MLLYSGRAPEPVWKLVITNVDDSWFNIAFPDETDEENGFYYGRDIHGFWWASPLFPEMQRVETVKEARDAVVQAWHSELTLDVFDAGPAKKKSKLPVPKSSLTGSRKSILDRLLNRRK